MIKIALSFGLLLLTSMSFGQGHAILASFNIVQIGDGVQVNFAIKGGASCNGVTLERSGEDWEFETIDEISGVCGGSEFTEHYSMRDDTPIVGETSHYRLILGNQGRSTSIAFDFIPLNEDGILIFPNPTSDQARVKFSNPNGLEVQIKAFDVAGRKWLDSVSRRSEETILVDQWPEGMYFLKVQGQEMGEMVIRFQIVR